MYEKFILNFLSIGIFDVPNLAETLESRLKFKDILIEHAQEKLHEVKKSFKSQKKETIFVGIHSRRTDHVRFSIQKLDLKPISPSYYLDAMDIFRQKFPKKKYNLAFVYVSDDMEWGRQSIGSKKGGKGIFFIGEESEEIGRAHVRTPVTEKSRMPSSA